jgi:hypothetical protein
MTQLSTRAVPPIPIGVPACFSLTVASMTCCPAPTPMKKVPRIG